MEETERSLHDSIMIVRRAMKNDTIVAGGSAIDMELSNYLRNHSRTVALWVELAEIWSKVASGNLPQKCPKNDDSHTSEYLSNEIQLISAGFS